MAYVRNAWYVASWTQDLEAGKPLAMSILGEALVIYRTASGRVIALEDRCVHRLAPLSLGRCEGENLRCMYHGLLYNSDGKVVSIPGQKLIPPSAKVKSYPVVERHSWVWVWMGDSTKADPGLIPPAVGFDDPNWILGRGYLDYQAEARLINDNLLDFSHLTYVHANSFGAGEVFATQQPKITALERGVRVERWIENSHLGARSGFAEPVDSWQSYDFLIPGVLLMWSGGFRAGTAQACNYNRPNYDDAITAVTFTSQAVTPVGNKTARYFFSWGPHCRHGDAALRDMLMALANQAFAEDKAMIEAQQRVIDRTGHAQVMAIKHDLSVTLFNRLLEKWTDEQHELVA
jgi:phenylpropionate dioxygenase-like ring-hydroxylating dioxygenase large terminal subunit